MFTFYDLRISAILVSYLVATFVFLEGLLPMAAAKHVTLDSWLGLVALTSFFGWRMWTAVKSGPAPDEDTPV